MARNINTEKISVTIPRELAGEIKALIPQGEVSAFFTEALAYYLAFRKQRQSLKNGAGLWKEKDHPDLKTARDTTDYVHMLRKVDRSPAIHVNERKGHQYAP